MGGGNCQQRSKLKAPARGVRRTRVDGAAAAGVTGVYASLAARAGDAAAGVSGEYVSLAAGAGDAATSASAASPAVSASA